MRQLDPQLHIDASAQTVLDLQARDCMLSRCALEECMHARIPDVRPGQAANDARLVRDPWVVIPCSASCGAWSTWRLGSKRVQPSHHTSSWFRSSPVHSANEPRWLIAYCQPHFIAHTCMASRGLSPTVLRASWSHFVCSAAKRVTGSTLSASNLTPNQKSFVGLVRYVSHSQGTILFSSCVAEMLCKVQ